MNSPREVVWSEFASAALAVVMKDCSRHHSSDDGYNAQAAANLADRLMDEFDKRFPQEQES